VAGDDSTLAGLAETPRGTLGRWAQRCGISAVALLVGAGALGLFGPRTGTTDASAGDYRLHVEHAAITRAGQPAPLNLRIERAGGFSGPVQVSLCDDFFDDLDFQNWYPNPSAEMGTSRGLIYEFDSPPGPVLEVSLDARTAPGQFGEVQDCRVAVLENDQPVVSAAFDVWVMP
jgi:hypothetical protein